MSRTAVILAGGRGSRLRPYTLVLPKPLMPIGDLPILEVIIRQLAHFQFDRVRLAVNEKANLLKAFFDDGSKWKIKIDYSLETMPLSTIGPLRLIPDLPENFLLMNGDILTDLDMGRLYREHVEQGRLFTVAASERTELVDYGVLGVDQNGKLNAFQEKPANKYLVSMGIYIVNRRILDRIPPEKPYGFDNLMLDLLACGESVHVEHYGGYWLDIGRADDYARANNEFESRRGQLLYDAE